jgi:uroporphyrin-III C-methyltransferase
MGKVFLVGAGPGDPDLLTVKAIRLLQSASIVLHDSLVSVEILALISPRAQQIDVGKRRGFRLLSQEDINSLLVASAASHQIIVRLKGGDPLLFGRAAEEIGSLREAGVDFEVVPGISAAFAAAAAAKISLSDRRVASNVLFTTFSRSADARALAAFTLTPETTVVVYMPGPHYNEVSQWLLDAGFSPDMPCQVSSKASQRDHSSLTTSLAGLAVVAPLPAPAVLVVGRVVGSLSDPSARRDWCDNAAPATHDLGLPL